jgi:hypothetical protein
MILAHLLSGSEIQTRYMLVIRDAYVNTYFTDTANHDQDLVADSDTYNRYEDAEDMNTTTTNMSANSYDSANDGYNEMSPQNKDWIAVCISLFCPTALQQQHVRQFTDELGFERYIYDKVVDPPLSCYLMKWDAAGDPIAHSHHKNNWSLDEEYILMGEAEMTKMVVVRAILEWHGDHFQLIGQHPIVMTLMRKIEQKSRRIAKMKDFEVGHYYRPQHDFEYLVDRWNPP